MRLVCPNCAAQYEVDDAVIPAEGRDVLCSNCGHAWFQPGAHVAAVPKPEADVAPEMPDAMPDTAPDTVPAAVPAATTSAVAEDTAIPEAAPELAARDTADDADAVADDPGDTPDMIEADTARSDLTRRALDTTVLDVLREEAAREAQARRSEGSSLETQTEMGLVPPEPALRPDMQLAEAAGADATPQGDALPGDDIPDDALPDAAPTGPQRRALLPDIEMINSTLTAASERRDPAYAGDGRGRNQQWRGGFRMGFSLALIAAVLLLALYTLAPALSQRMPGLAPTLTAYVQKIDSARIWLDSKARTSADALREQDVTTR